MATEAQNLSREMILPAYKAALHLPALSIAEVSRILYNCRGSSTNRLLFMQNKPNFLRGQINATLFAAKDYENKWQRRVRKNKPKTNPIQTQTNPISEKPKMNLNFYSTKDYDNKPPLRAPGKQTQNEPNQTQFLLAQSPHLSQLPTAEIKPLRGVDWAVRRNSPTVYETRLW